MKYLIILAFTSFALNLKAQDSSKAVVFSAYVETFYAYEFNRPLDNRRPTFLYNHNRQNEFNINLAYVKAAYSTTKTRANIALATGTYISDNYANEPGVLKNILEANVGIQLGKKWWLDAGIMPAHIGFESAISKDCWALTRSLAAENSPYFESGAKLSFTPNEALTLSVLALNGWQRISRINTSPSVGSQIFWKPNAKIALNWSTFYGNDRPDSSRSMRFFNNFYGIFALNDKLGITTGFDIGSEKATNGNSKSSIWYTPVVIVRYQMSQKWTIAGRFENYTDIKGVIITPDFKVTGYSINLDFVPYDNAIFRVETRFLNSKNNLFLTQKGIENSSFYATGSLSIGF
jgi:hypothetical protein